MTITISGGEQSPIGSWIAENIPQAVEGLILLGIKKAVEETGVSKDEAENADDILPTIIASVYGGMLQALVNITHPSQVPELVKTLPSLVRNVLDSCVPIDMTKTDFKASSLPPEILSQISEEIAKKGLEGKKASDYVLKRVSELVSSEDKSFSDDEETFLK